MNLSSVKDLIEAMVEWYPRGYIDSGVWNHLRRKVNPTMMAPVLQHLPPPPHPPGLVGFMFEVGQFFVYKLTIINIGNLKGHPRNSPTPRGPSFLRFLWVSQGCARFPEILTVFK